MKVDWDLFVTQCQSTNKLRLLVGRTETISIIDMVFVCNGVIANNIPRP